MSSVVPLTPHPLELRPRHALGPLVLASSLYSTLNTLIANKSTFPRLNISFSPDSPLTSPIFIDLDANGVRLRFDGESQRLQLIEITDFTKLAVMYNNTNLRYFLPLYPHLLTR